MNLSAIDINLVVALDALLRERSVTRAAKRLGLSQPAMSHALMRLREALGDPLLVRVGRKMTLTERAESLTGRVSALIQDLEGLFGGAPAPFDAAESTRTFHVAVSDYAGFVVLPGLQALFAKEAPRARLEAVSSHGLAVIASLRSRDIDLALGPFPPEAVTADVRRADLLSDRFVGLAGLHHLKMRGPADMATYLAVSHVLVASQGETSDPVTDLLAGRGVSRRVSMTVPHLLVAPHIVATSDLVATLPERVAQIFSTALLVRTFDPPFHLPTPETAMLWHHRTQNDPAHAWIRRLVNEAARRTLAGGRIKRTPDGSRD